MYVGAVREDDKPATTSMNDEAIEDSITTKKVSYRLRNSTFSVTWTKNTTGAYLVLSCFFSLVSFGMSTWF